MIFNVCKYIHFKALAWYYLRIVPSIKRTYLSPTNEKTYRISSVNAYLRSMYGPDITGRIGPFSSDEDCTGIFRSERLSGTGHDVRKDIKRMEAGGLR